MDDARQVARWLQSTPLDNKAGDCLNPFSCADIGKHKRPFSPHTAAIPVHNSEISSYMRRQINLVDHQQIATGDTGATFTRDFIPC